MTGWLRHVLSDRLQLGPEWLRRVRRGVYAAACGLSMAIGLWFGVARVAAVLWSHPYFVLSSVAVEGNRSLSREEVLRWAGVREGNSIWDAPPVVLRRRLLRHPAIAQVAAWREFPNRLVIKVQERHPVAIVLLQGLQYVDRFGHVLGPLREEDSRDFPLISGLDDARARDFVPIGLRRAVRLLGLWERMNTADALSEIHVDQQTGVTIFPMRTAAAVVLGWGGWREKLARSARVFAVWEGQVGRLAAVDLSFRDVIVVRLHEQQPPAVVRTPKRGLRV